MAPKRILVINPNTSVSMTKSVDQLIEKLQEQGQTSTHIETYTAPKGVASINNEDDAKISSDVVFEDLKDRFSTYNGILVACYSVHPLVTTLRDTLDPTIHVTGIFEASITASLSILPATGVRSKFGIVSTGTYWEKALSDGVRDFLGLSEIAASNRFKGVETTGLNADELHSAPAELVRQKMIDATKRLVRDRDVKIICLGCAGMTGLDSIVETALVEELGAAEAKQVHVLDGVAAGIVALEGLVRVLPGKTHLGSN
jgi:Asp/Glu/hydantoin racemase